MQYLVVIEEDPSSFGGYVPDLPGCIAAGATRVEAARPIHEAIEFHIEGMKEWPAHCASQFERRIDRGAGLKTSTR